MDARVRVVGSVVALAVAVLCVGIDTAASSSAVPPWGTHCTGAKAKAGKEKPFIVQACQRAYSAAARTRASAARDTTHVTKATADAARADNADNAVEATDAARDAAHTAAYAADDNAIAHGNADNAAAAHAAEYNDAAREADTAAFKAAKDPTDVGLANKAASTEERAVESARAAFNAPEPVEIPQL
ncbi:hypothetical protein ABZ942_13220 [Nocardia sp. NPDC046473]|uniref:hypothetical protein n=1 Tax=Nocardia sp. NPDC046473 TaxID=3155733 RepID=UPI0033E7582D